jgi:hypothetical protein
MCPEMQVSITNDSLQSGRDGTAWDRARQTHQDHTRVYAVFPVTKHIGMEGVQSVKGLETIQRFVDCKHRHKNHNC